MFFAMFIGLVGGVGLTLWGEKKLKEAIAKRTSPKRIIDNLVSRAKSFYEDNIKLG